jgi:hypothetical protein
MPETAMRSTVPVPHGSESFSAIDRVVLDLDLQVAFDQVAELGVQGGVIRIDAEQELLIARIQERVAEADMTATPPYI